MDRFCFLLICLIVSFACVLHANTLHVVHNQHGNNFSINGYDLHYELDDKDFWIKTGDVLAIEDIQTIELPGDSFSYLVTVVSFDKNRRQAFSSRVICRQNTAIVLQAKEYSRTTTNPKWIPGSYHPEVCYQLTMEDGSEYSLSCYYSSYNNDDEAQAVLATMLVEPGDQVTFVKINQHSYWESPYLYEYDAVVNHNGDKRHYRLKGLLRSPSKPLKKTNTFQVAYAGIHQIYGIFPRSFNKVQFQEFLPTEILIVHYSDMSMEEISKKGALQFVRTESSSKVYVFKDPVSSKQTRLSIWKSPGF